MNFAFVTFALLGVVAADVSHLNNMYLPPVLSGLTHTQHVSYVQKSQEIPQTTVQEVVDNSVVENVAAQEEAQIANGQLVIGSAQFGDASQGHTHTAGIVAQHIQNAADISRQVETHAQQALTSAVAAVEPAAPGSEVYHSTQQQTAYYTQVNQQQEGQEPQKYYTGAIVRQPQLANIDVPGPQQVQGQQYQHQSVVPHVQHNVAVTAPVVQTYSQQQNTGYYGQQSVSVDSSASAGIDTQYAANGGYVY